MGTRDGLRCGGGRMMGMGGMGGGMGRMGADKDGLRKA